VDLLTTVKWLDVLRLRLFEGLLWVVGWFWVNVAVRALFWPSVVFSEPYSSFSVGCCVLKNEYLLGFHAIFAIWCVFLLGTTHTRAHARVRGPETCFSRGLPVFAGVYCAWCSLKSLHWAEYPALDCLRMVLLRL